MLSNTQSYSKIPLILTCDEDVGCGTEPSGLCTSEAAIC